MLVGCGSSEICHCPGRGQVVDLMDGVLEGVIREAIGKDSGTLTVDDMSQLVELDVSVEKRGPNAPAIRNLKGLETAVHLQALNLSGAFPLVFDVMQDPNNSWQCVCTDCAMGSEGPANLFDGQPTKWRGLVNSFGCAGFMVTPKDVSTHVQSIRLRSANDNPGKDPKMIVIEGSNDEETRPSDYDYLSIQTSSFKNILQLASKLLQSGDSLTKYLYSSITQVSRDLIRLAIDKKDVPSDLKLRLARDLNRIMSQSSLYTERRFRDVVLRPETLALLDSPLDGITLVHLNRLLLEDAFPEALLHHRNPWQQIATVDVSWLRFGFNRLTSLQLPPGLTELSDILELDMMLNPIQRLEIPFGMNPDMIWLLGATGVDHVFYIPFSLGRSGGMLELIWPEGVLQSVHSFGEDWTTVEGATSPYRFTPSTPHTFFRVMEE